MFAVVGAFGFVTVVDGQRRGDASPPTVITVRYSTPQYTGQAQRYTVNIYANYL